MTGDLISNLGTLACCVSALISSISNDDLMDISDKLLLLILDDANMVSALLSFPNKFL
jgi:hypothetical protein